MRSVQPPFGPHNEGPLNEGAAHPERQQSPPRTVGIREANLLIHPTNGMNDAFERGKRRALASGEPQDLS
jgi:hypothetical protein